MYAVVFTLINLTERLLRRSRHEKKYSYTGNMFSPC